MRRRAPRISTTSGARCGSDRALPGWRSDVPRDGILHAVDQSRSCREQLAARVSAGTLEGCPADPLRRSGAAGATRRLDLPGAAERAAPPDVTYDTVVIGTGLAGSTAALRLADEGERVLPGGEGVGSTHLAPATIDVLGFDRSASRARAGAARVRGRGPDHPYARLSSGLVAASLDWLKGRGSWRSATQVDLDENLLLPTAVSGGEAFGARAGDDRPPATSASGAACLRWLGLKDSTRCRRQPCRDAARRSGRLPRARSRLRRRAR